MCPLRRFAARMPILMSGFAGLGFMAYRRKNIAYARRSFSHACDEKGNEKKTG